MQLVLHDFAVKRFGLRHSTFVFILLVLATCFLFYYVWIWKLVNRASSQRKRDGNRVIAILIMAFLAWSGAVYDSFPVDDVDTFFNFIGATLGMAGCVLVLVLSFRIRDDLEYLLAQARMPVHMNGFLCFIFPIYYQYYVIWNAEQMSYKQQLVQSAYKAAPQPGAQPAPSRPSHAPGQAPYASAPQQPVAPQPPIAPMAAAAAGGAMAGSAATAAAQPGQPAPAAQPSPPTPEAHGQEGLGDQLGKIAKEVKSALKSKDGGEEDSEEGGEEYEEPAETEEDTGTDEEEDSDDDDDDDDIISNLFS